MHRGKGTQHTHISGSTAGGQQATALPGHRPAHRPLQHRRDVPQGQPRSAVRQRRDIQPESPGQGSPERYNEQMA